MSKSSGFSCGKMKFYLYVTPYTEIMTRIIAVLKFESKAPTLLKNGIFS